MKKFNFAKYYDITEIARKYNTDYCENEKIHLCVDTWDFWLCRIVKGYNSEYEKEEGSFLVERNKIAKEYKGENILSHQDIQNVLEQDDFCNWDYKQYFSLEECIEAIDGGYGINQVEWEETDDEIISEKFKII